MRMKLRGTGRLWLVLAATAWLTRCQPAPALGGDVPAEELRDGSYEGNYRRGPNSVVARVTIENGRISRIELVKHTASWIGRKADGVIEQRIIENQSTKVDAVSGATNSSHCIMNAVHQAMEKASQPPSQQPEED